MSDNHQVHDALRHLEKDMQDILETLNDNDVTEVILNPYRKQNGSYEGHILVDRHGDGLRNLLKFTGHRPQQVTLESGDMVFYTYLENHTTISIISRVKLPTPPTNQLYHQLNYILADCLCTSINFENDPPFYLLDKNLIHSLVNYATLIEDGIVLKDVFKNSHSSITLLMKNIVDHLNKTIPAKLNLKCGYAEINRQNINNFSCQSLTTKVRLVKMSATKAETIMSVLASITGKFIHNKSPYLECHIPKYGHRFTGVIPPASNFPSFCIRSHLKEIYTLDDLVAQGVLQDSSRATIKSWVRRKLNILIAGGTGSGKTTLANAILHEITTQYPDERMLVIEDVPELRFNTSRSVSFTTNEFFSMYDALRTTLRFKPDRIIMGEVRGAEAYTLLKAWNTGHPGGVATIHANGVDEALYRFESCICDHPQSKINRQEIGFTINAIISIQKLTVREILDGAMINQIRRRVTALRQIINYDASKDIYQDIVFDRLEQAFE